MCFQSPSAENPQRGRSAALWNDAPGGKHKQMFATKHVQPHPPHPFHHSPSPPLAAETHSLTCETLPGRQEHVFDIKLLNALSNTYSLIVSFHICILPLYLGAGLAECQTEVSSGSKVYEPQPGGESEPHCEKESGLVDIHGKTNSLTSKSWQTCWWVLWFLCFSPRCL